MALAEGAKPIFYLRTPGLEGPSLSPVSTLHFVLSGVVGCDGLSGTSTQHLHRLLAIESPTENLTVLLTVSASATV